MLITMLYYDSLFADNKDSDFGSPNGDATKRNNKFNKNILKGCVARQENKVKVFKSIL